MNDKKQFKKYILLTLLCLSILFVTLTGCESKESETADPEPSETYTESAAEPPTEEAAEPKHETRMLGVIQKKKHFSGSQDGAIFGDTLFTFSSNGKGTVYRYSDGYLVGRARVQGSIIPHVNSACFSDHFMEETDAFPLLYLCVYNNYSENEDRLLGTCMVYRPCQEKMNVDL